MLQQQVQAHHPDTGFGNDGHDADIGALRLLVQAEGAGDGGASHIRIQNGCGVALTAHQHGQHGGDQAFAHAALAADHADQLFDMGHVVGLFKQILRRGARCAGAGACGAVMGAIFAHDDSFYSDIIMYKTYITFNIILIWLF